MKKEARKQETFSSASWWLVIFWAEAAASSNTLKNTIVRCCLIFSRCFFANRIYLELGLSVVLQVLAVSKDLTSLDKGNRLPQTFLLANLGVLHPRLKHLHAEISWI